MNLLGTHDTDRILTVLGGADVDSMTNAELSTYRLSPEARETEQCKEGFVPVANLGGTHQCKCHHIDKVKEANAK